MAKYPKFLMEHFQNPRNVGEISDPDGIGTVGNASCGDIMQMFIKVNSGKIIEAKFKTFGCGAAIATSSILTERIKGATLDEAMTYMAEYGSQHTEVIITEDYSNAQRFLAEVDASAVMVNASTRFNDGGQLGLGAEIGISTTKLHAYGPMGLEELTSKKFIVYGAGQVRS